MTLYKTVLVACVAMFGMASIQSADATETARESLVEFIIVGTVTKISDGDTIIVTEPDGEEHNIRFSDIDTPETFHGADRPGQPGGEEATEALKTFVSVGDTVTNECYEMGHYGRPICHVFKDGLNVNLEMLKTGWAWPARRAEWIRDPESLPASEAARSSGKGAWSLPGQVHPGKWRKDCWKDGNCPGAIIN